MSIWKAPVQEIGVLWLSLLLVACSTPRIVRELKQVDAVGELFYEEHRPHECGTNIGGFMCEHRCGSFVFKYWRAQGDFEQNVNALQSKLIGLGFEPVETDYGRRLWSWNYATPGREVNLFMEAGTETWRGKSVVIQAPRNDPLTGEYVYGVEAGYQTAWDLTVQSWRNSTFMFRTCTGDDQPGFPVQPN